MKGSARFNPEPSIPLNPHIAGGDIKVYLLTKPNFMHMIRFTIYNIVYYIITYNELLIHNAYPLPRFWHKSQQDTHMEDYWLDGVLPINLMWSLLPWGEGNIFYH